MENITTLSCTNISAGFGFTYMVLPYMLSVLRRDEDCEQAWYDEEQKCLSHGHEIWNITGLVVGVTSESITLSECIKLYCNVNCDGSGHKLRHLYQVTKDDVKKRVRNITTPGAANMYEAHTGIIIIIIIAALLVLGILIGVMVAAWCYVNRRNQLPAEDEEGSSHGGANYPLNTMETESEEPRDVRMNGSVNGVNQALPLQASNATDDES